jgi:hypothetical protein
MVEWLCAAAWVTRTYCNLHYLVRETVAYMRWLAKLRGMYASEAAGPDLP